IGPVLIECPDFHAQPSRIDIRWWQECGCIVVKCHAIATVCTHSRHSVATVLPISRHHRSTMSPPCYRHH
ncbi:hypothetical protein, partial [Escherichia coli]|uniref:hypothetical protein n=1 Tax=Escherichia coli TaxID=562 RepID=UPI00388D4005